MNENKYIDRLIELSKEHLNCTIEGFDRRSIPGDLIPGEYNWYSFLYSNLYTRENDLISKNDKDMFLDISKKLRFEHLINWCRIELLFLNKWEEENIKNCIQRNIRETKNFFILRANIYALRSILNSWYIIDQVVLGLVPNLKPYILSHYI